MRRRSLVAAALLAGGLFVGSGFAGRVAPAGASGPSCTVNAPEGLPASSKSGVFPIEFACSGFPSNTTGVRFDVSGDGQTVEVRDYVDSAQVATESLGASFSMLVMPSMLPFFGFGGDCGGGATPAMVYGATTLASVGPCFDSTNWGTECGCSSATWSPVVGQDLVAQTVNNNIGGTPGANLQYATGTSWAGAACNATFTCGTVSFVAFPRDLTTSALSYFPTGVVTGGLLAVALGLAIGLVMGHVRSL